MIANAWKVERWGGNANHGRRVVFVGAEHKARQKFKKLHVALRQGTVELINEAGLVIERTWAPRLRTRW